MIDPPHNGVVGLGCDYEDDIIIQHPDVEKLNFEYHNYRVPRFLHGYMGRGVSGRSIFIRILGAI